MKKRLLSLFLCGAVLINSSGVVYAADAFGSPEAFAEETSGSGDLFTDGEETVSENTEVVTDDQTESVPEEVTVEPTMAAPEEIPDQQEAAPEEVPEEISADEEPVTEETAELSSDMSEAAVQDVLQDTENPVSVQENLTEMFEDNVSVDLLGETTAASSGTCGEDLTWKLENYVLTISGTGAMTDYSYGQAPWYGLLQDSNLRVSLVLDDRITKIGTYAFYNCISLYGAVTLPSAVTEIGDGAFSGCSNLNGNLKLPSELNSIGAYAFSGCMNISGMLAIPAGVTQLKAQAFQNCSGLTGLTLPEKLTGIGNRAFSGCSSIAGEVAIPDGVTTISTYTFESCSSITGITLGTGLQTIGSYAFSGCSGVKSLTFKGQTPPTEYYGGIQSMTSLETMWVPSGTYAAYNAAYRYEIPQSARIRETGSEDEFLIQNGVLVGYQGEGGAVVIPDDVTAVGDYAFSRNTLITSVTFHSGIKSIGNYAFDGTGLTGTLTIPEGVESIGAYAFGNSKNLNSVQIGNSVTAIGNYAFTECTRLNSVTFGNQLTTIGTGAFYNCTSLTSIGKLPDTLTQIGESAFCNCTELSGNLELPLNLNSIGASAFSGCSSLTGKLVIPDSVTTMGVSAFYYCSGFTGLTISANLTQIAANTFSNCSGLSGTLVIPDQVTSIGYYAFRNCGELTEITIGANVATVNYGNSSNGAFDGCSKVTKITFLGAEPPTNGGYYSPWGSMSSLTEVWVPAGSYEAYQSTYGSSLPATVKIRETGSTGDFLISEAGILIGYQGSGGEIVIPENVTGIGENAFLNQTAVTKVTFHDQITAIGAGAFQNTGLTGAVEIPDSVITIGNNAFYKCTGITGIQLGGGVTSIGNNAFYGCIQMTGTVTVPDSVTTIGAYAFYDCAEITGLTLGAALESIGNYAFSGCCKLSGDLVLPSGVTNIGAYAFYNCSLLTGALVIPNSVTTLESGAFQGCSGFTGLTLADGLTQIAYGTFSGCAGLKGQVIIPDAVTEIGNYAFYSCNQITGMKFGTGLIRILGDDVFSKCTQLKELTFTGEQPPQRYGYNLFYNMTALETIYVPMGTYQAYNEQYRSYLTSAVKIRETGNDEEFLISDEGVLVGYQGNGGIVTIPDKVTAIGNYAFSKNTSVTGIILPERLTSIGDNAFEYTGLTDTVMIPDQVTEIGANAFRECRQMTGIQLGNAVASVGNYAFYNCTELTGKLVLPDALTDLGYSAFENCSKLTGSLELPAKLTTIGSSTFSNCSQLTGTLKLPDGVTTIGSSAFSNCSQLTGTLKLPDGVTTIGGSAFYNCKQLTGSLEIPNSVTAIGSSAFSNCGFSGLTLSENMKTIEAHAFSDCTELTGAVVIPDSVTSIYYNAFLNCTKITEITVGSAVTNVGNFAKGCTGIKKMTFMGAAPPYGSNLFNDMEKLEIVYVPKGSFAAYNTAYRNYLPAYVRIRETGAESDFLVNASGELTGYQGNGGNVVIPENVTSIGDYAFSKNTSVTGITLHDGVTSIGDHAFDNSGLTGKVVISDGISKIGTYAFAGCAGITEIQFGKAVYNIGDYAFEDCTQLTGTLTIPDNVKTIGNSTFYGCTGLTGLSLGNQLWKIGSSAFYRCTGLTGTGVLPETLEEIGNSAFAGCTGLTGELLLPESVQYIGAYAFDGCSSLTGELVLPDGLTTLGNNAFQSCYGLTGVKLPENMKTISGNLFYGCTGITGEVVIPDKVESIGSYAFYNCSGITAFVIGSGVKSLHDSFTSCSGVKTLTFSGTTPPMLTYTWTNPFSYMSALERIYVPDDSLIETYQTAYKSLVPETVEFTADITTSQPQGLKAQYVSSKRVVLCWKKMISSKIAGYVIYKNGNEIGRTEEALWEDTEVTVGTAGSYEISGYTADDTETKKAALTVTPKLPEIMSVYTNGCETDTLGGTRTTLYAKVTNTGGFDGYGEGVCKGTFSYERDGEEISIGDAVFQTSNSSYGVYAVKMDLTDIPEDYYKVWFRYTDAEGETAEQSAAIFVRQSGPEKITGVKAIDDTNQIVLNWDISAENTSIRYFIYKKKAEEKEFSLLTRIDNRNTLNYTDTRVDLDSFYDYYVVTMDEYGQFSEPSDIVRGCPNKDVVLPEITGFTPKDGAVLSGTVAVSASAKDNIGIAAMELLVSLDNGETWNSIGTSDSDTIYVELDTTGYSDGEIQMKAIARDTRDNVSDGTPVRTWRVDNTGPAKVTGLRSEATAVAATLYWDNVDAEDFSFFRVEELQGEGWVTVSDVYRTLGTNIYGLAPDSSYTYRVAAYDKYNNRGEASDEITVQTLSDTVVPVISSLSPQSGRYKDKITFTAEGSDTYGIAGLSIQYSRDLKTWTEAASQTYEAAEKKQTLTTELNISQMEEGSIYLRGVAKDFAENESATGEEAPYVEFIIDRTAPAVPQGLKAECLDGMMNVSWEQGREEDLNSYQVQRSENGTDYVQVAEKLYTLNYIDKATESNKKYYYKICATDTAGNVSDMTEAVSCTMEPDTTVPVIQSVSPADGSTFTAEDGGTLQLGTVVTDNRMLSQIRFYWKKTAEEEYTLLKEITEINELYSISYADCPVESIVDGQKLYFKVEAADGENNEAVPAEFTCTVDRKAPEVYKPGVTQMEDRTVKIHWNSGQEEDLAGYYVYRMPKGGEWKLIGAAQAEKDKIIYSVTDQSILETAGTYTYKVEALDTLGNKSEKQAGTAIFKDFTAPKAALDSENLMETGVEYVFDASGTTDDTEIVRYQFDFGDGNVEEGIEERRVHKYTEAGSYTVRLTAEDGEGNTGSCERQVTIRDRSTLGAAEITVKDDSGKTVSNAPVYMDLGKDTQFIRYTDALGKVTVTAGVGKHTVGCFKSGYLPVKKELLLLSGETITTELTITEEELVTGEFEVQRMTLEEIVSAGIDVTAPENQYVAKAVVHLTYGSQEMEKEFYFNWKGNILGTGSGGFSVNVGGEMRWWIPHIIRRKTSDGSGSGSTGGTEDELIIAFMDIPVEVSALKEFFNVRLHIMNNASSEFPLLDNNITLNVPEGLSIVQANHTLSGAKAYVDKIAGGTTKTLEWILRGDQVGQYDLSADYSGILAEFNESVSAHFETSEPIEVFGFSNCRLKITIPRNIDSAGTLPYSLRFTNEGDINVYCPKLTIRETDEIASMQYISQNGTEFIDDFPDTLKPGESIEMECYMSTECAYYTLYDWYLSTYSDYGLQVEVEVDEGDYKDSSIVVTAAGTEDVLKNKEMTINGTASKTDAEGRIYLSVQEQETLTVQCDGYYDYVVDWDKILGDGGTHKIALKVVDVLDSPYVSSLYYKDDSDSWRDIFSDKIYVFQDENKKYTLEAKADWLNHEEGTFVLSQDADHKLESSDGIFRDVVLKDVFQPGKTVYIYVVSRDGTYSKPVETKISMETGDNLLAKLDGTAFKLGSDLEVTIPDAFPIIGGNKMSINLDNSPLYVEVKGDTVKMGIGLNSKDETEYNLTKKFFDKIDDAKTAEIQYEIMRKMCKRFGGVATKPLLKETDFNYGVMGYVEGGMTSQGFVVTEGQIAVYMEFSGSLTKQLISPPVFLSFKLGARAGANGTITRVLPDSSIPFTLSVELYANPYFKATGGVGVKDAIAIELTGGVEMNLNWELLNNYQKVTGKATVNVQGYVGPWTFLDKDLISEEKTFYENNPSAKAAAQAAESDVVEAEDWISKVYDQSNYQAVSGFDYESEWLGTDAYSADGGAGSEEAAGDQLLQDNVYPDARQTHLKTEDTEMMVWLSQDSNRASQNSTVVVFSVYDEATDTWSTPKPIADDGTADISPKAAVNGNEIYVIWQNTSKVLDETETSLEALSQNTEIRTAVYDESTGEFTVSEAMPKDETVGTETVSDPRIASGDGETYAVWTANTAGDIFGISGTNSILASKMTENGWSAPKVLAQELPMIASYDILAKDGTLYTAAAVEQDKDIATREDWEIYEYRWHGDDSVNGQRLTENIVADYKPYYGEENEKTVLYWNSGQNMRKRYLDSGEESDTGLGSGTGRTQVFTENGSYLFWIGDSTESRDAMELYCAAFNEETGTYSSPVCITDRNKYLTSFQAVPQKNGNITIYYQARSIAEENGVPVLGSSGFYRTTITPAADLCVSDNVSVQNGKIYPGANVTFDLLVQNKGMFPVDTYLLQVLDETGKAVCSRNMETLLASGEAQEITLDYVLPEDFTGQTYTVRGVLNEGTEENTGNNSCEIEIQGRNVQVQSVQAVKSGGTAVCILKAENTGAVTLENPEVIIHEDAADGKIIARKAMDTLKSGEIGTWIYALSLEDVTAWKDGIVKLYFEVTETAADGTTVSDTGATALYHDPDGDLEITVAETREVQGGIEAVLLLENKALSAKDTVIFASVLRADGGVAGYKTEKLSLEAGETDTMKLTILAASPGAGWKVGAGVMVPVQQISLNQTAVTLKCTGRTKLSAELMPQAPTDSAVIWTSSNPAAAAAAADGTVMAKAPGETVITCKAADGFGAQAQCRVVVSEHNFTWVEKAADCVNGGYKYEHCTDCGLERNKETFGAKGHQFTSVIKAANCAADGYQYQKCTVCGQETPHEVLKATGLHTYGEYVVKKEATVLQEGEKVRTCSVCGHQDTANIPKPAGVLKLNTSGITLKLKQSTTKVKVTSMGKGDRVISWKSSSSRIVKVSSKGKITAQRKTGTAYITVKLASGISRRIRVKVQKGTVRTTRISGLSRKIRLAKGKKLTLKPVISPLTSQEKVKYTSSNKRVVYVSSRGIIKALRPGTAKITVQSGRKKYVIAVTVTKR